MIDKTKVVTISGKQYSIPFPKIRQQFEIQNRKVLFTNSTYGNQEQDGTPDSAFNLNLVDAIATFATLLPELSKDLKVDSLGELDLMEAKDILKAYKKDFYPWYQSIKEEINKELTDDTPEVKKD